MNPNLRGHHSRRNYSLATWHLTHDTGSLAEKPLSVRTLAAGMPRERPDSSPLSSTLPRVPRTSLRNSHSCLKEVQKRLKMPMAQRSLELEEGDTGGMATSRNTTGNWDREGSTHKAKSPPLKPGQFINPLPCLGREGREWERKNPKGLYSIQIEFP